MLDINTFYNTSDLYTNYETFLTIGLITLLYSCTDYVISKKYQGSYYMIHSINNALIVLCSCADVLDVSTNPYTAFQHSSTVTLASNLTYGLHFYHIIMYIKKLRFDDWLHHGLMIFVALPIGNYFGPTKLLSNSLFYTTGLPGMIDYGCLALVRNKKMERLTEKNINRYLNTYIRNPGCTIHTFITVINMVALMNRSFFLSNKVLNNPNLSSSYMNIFMCSISAIIVFWNGIYFMDQVVGNLYVEKERAKVTLPKNYNA